MAKQSTQLEETDFSIKWGLVTVQNVDGTLNRQYVITAAETLAVVQGNNVLPPGVTTEEWGSGRVFVSGRPLNVGQVFKNPDDTLMVNYDVKKTKDRVTISLMKLQSHEWEKLNGVVFIEAAVAATVNVPKRIVTEIKETNK